MSRRAARVDANHAQIVQALRSCGWMVVDTSRVGGGFPDALAARAGRLELIEIKDGAKVPSARKLTPAEVDWHASMAAAGVTVRIVSRVEDVIALCG